MAEYDNSNRGALFANDRKTSDTQPTHTGTINAVCPCCQAATDYWLSAWIKDKKNGPGRFFSLSVKPKDANATPTKPAAPQQAKPSQQSGYDDGFNDEIPF